jgi:UPF0716 family protein affecting phage T7 exclusion
VWWERALLVAAALLLIKPGYITDAIGVVLLVVGMVLRKSTAKVAQPARP